MPVPTLKDMAGARMRSMQRGAGAPDDCRGERCLRPPVRGYAKTPLAVVAVLEALVMGGGFGLACVADVALADDGASFTCPRLSLGVVPADRAVSWSSAWAIRGPNAWP